MGVAAERGVERLAENAERCRRCLKGERLQPVPLAAFHRKLTPLRLPWDQVEIRRAGGQFPHRRLSNCGGLSQPSSVATDSVSTDVGTGRVEQYRLVDLTRSLSGQIESGSGGRGRGPSHFGYPGNGTQVFACPANSIV